LAAINRPTSPAAEDYGNDKAKPSSGGGIFVFSLRFPGGSGKEI